MPCFFSNTRNDSWCVAGDYCSKKEEKTLLIEISVSHARKWSWWIAAKTEIYCSSYIFFIVHCQIGTKRKPTHNNKKWHDVVAGANTLCVFLKS